MMTALTRYRTIRPAKPKSAMAAFIANLSLIVILIGVLILENLLRVGMAEQTA